MKTYLRLCAEIEETVEKVYQVFAQKVEGGAEMQLLWLQLARDEETHYNQLLMAERLANEKVFTAPQLSEQKVTRLLEQARQLLEKAQAGPLTPKEALLATIMLEKGFADVHIANATQIADPSLQKTFAALARSDEEHLLTLRNYLERNSR